MSYYALREARKASFSLVGETCPHVDEALSDAARIIKEQTGALREALIEALARAIEAEGRVADLEYQVEQLESQLKESQ